MEAISDVRYMVEMGCGLDIWRIHGEVDGRLRCPSSPVSFDEEDDEFTTASGNQYKIMNYADDFGKAKFVEQIKKDIANKGFERVS